MEYVDHLNTLIRKSTFKIDPKYTDGWINPCGEYHPVNSHHHVEEALRIIKKYDTFVNTAKYNIEYTQKLINKTNEAIEFLKQLKKIKKKWDDSIDIANILNRQIEDLPSELYYELCNDIDTSIKICKGYIKQCDNDIKIYQEAVDTTVTEVSKFEKANKNKGYDAAEYIIINHGYIAVENGHLIYRNVCRKQLDDINCYVEKDENGRCVICKLSEEDIIQKKNKKKEECLSLVSYYRDFNNRFHCPSGFVRRDYARWENECYKCGLDPNTLIYH